MTRILCVTCVRNEAPFLLEWIAHYQGAGVTDFLIFSNDCDDGTHEMLDALASAGVVHHRPLSAPKNKSIQWHALAEAWKHPLRRECDWAIVCDVDEFVNIRVAGHTFGDLLGAYPDATDAIAIPWRLFGNSGKVFADYVTPVTQQFTQCAPRMLDFPLDVAYFKTLFRLDGPFKKFGVHRPKQFSPDEASLPSWMNSSGESLMQRVAANVAYANVLADDRKSTLVECNHYSLKSVQAFLLKRDRGLPNRQGKDIDLAYWVARNFNTQENTSIRAMAPQTQGALGALMALPEVRALHVQAINWHRERFMALMGEGEALDLFAHICLAGDTRQVDVNLGHKLHSLRAKAKRPPSSG